MIFCFVISLQKQQHLDFNSTESARALWQPITNITK